jgi:hypothetical protein
MNCEDSENSQNIKENNKTKKELLQERNEKIQNEIIEIVLRQTDMTSEEAYEKLKMCNFNFHKVIKDYMNPNPKKIEEKSINVQQTIYKEIRNMMDSGERNRRFQQELNDRLEKNKEN